MIRKVILKNFESHENSEIEFTGGFNLIVGQSNQGKSSIVRAIALAVANRFTKESVRTGAEFCTVRIETDRGFVQVERGEKVNRWLVGDGKDVREYRNIGAAVPPEASAVLGMSERVRGEIRELPNIMFQLEKHYMLSEIDGRKTTSNMIARMMDDAIGIGGMEELIRDMAADFAARKKELGAKNIQISEMRGRILDIAIFEGYRNAVEDIRKDLKEAESLRRMLADADGIHESVLRNRSRSERMTEALEVSEGLDELSAAASAGTRKLRLLTDALRNRRRHASVLSLLEASEGLDALTAKISRERSCLALLTGRRRNARALSGIGRRLAAGIAELDDDAARCGGKVRDIAAAERMLLDAREQYRKIRKISRRLIDTKRELSASGGRLEDLKRRLGNCPLCGSRL